MYALAPWRTKIWPWAELDALQERRDRDRIRRDETVLGTCRYASFCQAVQVRDEVLSTVAHDLRSPLHIIASSAALVRDLPLPEAKKLQLLDLITQTVERMNRLIQDLLDVSRIEAGKLALERRPVDVEALLAQTELLFRGLADEAGIDLVLQASPFVPAIDADPDRIHQVLSNLIGNALKFTPAGGRVSVLVAPDQDEAYVRFSVTDTGAGIPRKQMERLFDRFWQAETSHAAGAGLGLVIVKGIVEQHGGSITVESEPGRGSAFHFTVPAAGAQAD